MNYDKTMEIILNDSPYKNLAVNLYKKIQF